MLVSSAADSSLPHQEGECPKITKEIPFRNSFTRSHSSYRNSPTFSLTRSTSHIHLSHCKELLSCSSCTNLSDVFAAYDVFPRTNSRLVLKHSQTFPSHFLTSREQVENNQCFQMLMTFCVLKRKRKKNPTRQAIPPNLSMRLSLCCAVSGHLVPFVSLRSSSLCHTSQLLQVE